MLPMRTNTRADCFQRSNAPLLTEADELFIDIDHEIREKMRQEFAASTSITPGQCQLIKEQYDLLFQRIAQFRQMLDTALGE